MLTAFHSLNAQWRAAILMVLALFMFNLMGISIRLASAHVPVMEIVFFRNFLAVLLILPIVWRSDITRLRMNRPRLFFLRAGVNFVGMYCGFTAVTLIPLAEMTALGFTGPIFITIGAVLFLGEVIRLRRIIAVFFGFVGALIILQPGFSDISAGAILALTSAFSIAMASLVVKKLTITETSESIVFWMVAMQAPLAFFPMLMVWQTPDMTGWLLLFCVAGTGTIAHMLFTHAYRMVEITTLQPLEFIKLPFAVVLAWMVFGELPTIWIWLGGAVIFASTAYITRREAQMTLSQKPNHGMNDAKL